MPKFEVLITEYLTKSVIVEAEDANKAHYKVLDMWRSEEIILYPDDFYDVDFEVKPADDFCDVYVE